MKAIILQSLRTLGMNCTQVVIGLISSIILARSLGPDERGAYALAVLVAASMAMLSNPGIYAAANYFLGTAQLTSAEVLGTLLLAAGAAGLAGAVLSVLALPLLAAPLAHAPSMAWLVGGLTAAFILASSLNGLFFGAGKVRTITNWKMLLSGTQCLVFLAVAALAPSAAHYLLAFTSICAVDAIGLLLLFLYQERVWPRTSYTLLRRMLGYGVSVYGSRVLLFAGQRLDTYMVFFFAGTLALGHYTIAVTLAEQLWLLPLSVSMIMMPNLGRLSADDAAVLTATMLRLAATVGLLSTLALGLFTPLMLPLLYGTAYAPAVLPLLILLPGMTAAGLFNIAEPFFQSRGRPQLPLLITAAGLLTNALANLLLIPALGMPGAALASTLAYGLQFLVMCAAFARVTGVPVRSLLDLRRAYAELLGHARTQLGYLSARVFIGGRHADG